MINDPNKIIHIDGKEFYTVMVFNEMFCVDTKSGDVYITNTENASGTKFSSLGQPEHGVFAVIALKEYLSHTQNPAAEKRLVEIEKSWPVPYVAIKRSDSLKYGLP